MDPIKENTPSREHSIEPVTTHTRNKIVLRANRSTVHRPRGGGGSSTRTYNKRASKKNKLIKASKTRNKNNKEIISTSKEVNESRITPVEEPPREELPYDKFYPDLKLDEKLVVVYVSSKDFEDREEKEIKEETKIMKEESDEIVTKDENNLMQENGDVSEHQSTVENNIISASTTEQIQLEETKATTVLLNNNHQENNIQEMLSSINSITSIKDSESSLDSFASLPKNFEEETFTPKYFENTSSPKDLNEEMGEETSSSKISSPKLLLEKSFNKDEKEDHDDDDTASFKASSHDDMDEETIDEDEQEEMQIDLESNVVKLPDINGNVTINDSVDKEMDWTPSSPILSAENTEVIENGLKKDDVIVECSSTSIITTEEDNTPIVQPPPFKVLPVPMFKRINFTKEEPDEPFVRPEGHYIRHVGTSMQVKNISIFYVYTKKKNTKN
jgi:hypothetical protein